MISCFVTSELMIMSGWSDTTLLQCAMGTSTVFPGQLSTASQSFHLPAFTKWMDYMVTRWFLLVFIALAILSTTALRSLGRCWEDVPMSLSLDIKSRRVLLP